MCIATPGRVIKIEGSQGTVDVRGNVLPIELGIVNARVGDYVLVHAGIALSVVDVQEADELNELLREVDSYES